MLPVNRIVAICTPVFTLVAVAVSAYAAKHGLNASPAVIVGAEIIGATAVLTPAAQWLHGHQKYEKIVSEAEKDIATGAAVAAALPSTEEELDTTTTSKDSAAAPTAGE